MKHLKKLLALLLMLSMFFCLVACSVDVEKDDDIDDFDYSTAAKDDENVENSKKEKTKEEASFVGKWKVVHGYNANEGLLMYDDERTIELFLNEDLTGTLVENSEVVAFSWSYTGTSQGEGDPSVHFMNFQCVLEPGAVVPEDSIEEFFFDVQTTDIDTIYLTFGNWLYLCEKE